MGSIASKINNLLYRNVQSKTVLPIIPPHVNVTSIPIVLNQQKSSEFQQDSTENLRICIKHTKKEYFFNCPEKMCMHQVENDKYKIKSHIIEFHSKKATSFNIKEDNNVFCYFCSRCNRYANKYVICICKKNITKIEISNNY
jgi:hypothetical protein